MHARADEVQEGVITDGAEVGGVFGSYAVALLRKLLVCFALFSRNS